MTARPSAAAMPAPDRDPTPDLIPRLGAWLLAAVLLAVPLVFSSLTEDQFELPKLLALRALTSLLLGALLASLLARPARGWRRGPLDLPVLAWCAWLLVGTLRSVSPALSWRGEYENFAGSLTQLNYAALYFLAVQFAPRLSEARTAARALLAAAMAAALYAVLQSLGRDFMGWSASTVVAQRFFGTLGNPNFLGALMAMAICLRLGLATEALDSGAPEDRDGPWRWGAAGLWIVVYAASGQAGLLNPLLARPGASGPGAAVLALWLLALAAAPLLRRWGRPRAAYATALAADLLLLLQALAGTGTRGAFLGLMAGLGVLALGRLGVRETGGAGGVRRRLAGLRALMILGAVAVCLAAAFFALGPVFRQRTLATLRHPEKSLEVSRLEIWGPALRMARDHPIAGSGVDTFKSLFPRYCGSRFAEFDGQNVSSRMAHCEPLQILATQGAVGLALWLWLCTAAFVGWWRGLRDPAAGPGSGALALGLGGLLAAYLAQNLVSFGVAGISAPFWTCLGLLFSGRDLPRAGLRIPSPGKAWSLALGASLALAGLSLDSRTLRADIDFAFASEAQAELPALEGMDAAGAADTAAYALQGLGSLSPPARPDLAAEAALWEGRLEAAGPQGPPAGLARRAAAVLLMDLAAARMESAVSLCPDEVKYRIYLGLCYEEIFKRCDPDRRPHWFDLAERSYREGVDLNPANAYYRGDLGRLWGYGALSGDRDFYAKAETYYLQAVERAPVTRLFYENLLALEARFADVPGAEALLARAVRADREKAMAPRLLLEASSTFFQYRGSDLPPWGPAAVREAAAAELRWSEEAAALRPRDAQTALAVAILQLQEGRRREAAAWARKALGLDPAFTDAIHFLAQSRL